MGKASAAANKRPSNGGDSRPAKKAKTDEGDESEDIGSDDTDDDEVKDYEVDFGPGGEPDAKQLLEMVEDDEEMGPGQSKVLEMAIDKFHTAREKGENQTDRKWLFAEARALALHAENLQVRSLFNEAMRVAQMVLELPDDAAVSVADMDEAAHRVSVLIFVARVLVDLAVFEHADAQDDQGAAGGDDSDDDDDEGETKTHVCEIEKAIIEKAESAFGAALKAVAANDGATQAEDKQDVTVQIHVQAIEKLSKYVGEQGDKAYAKKCWELVEGHFKAGREVAAMPHRTSLLCHNMAEALHSCCTVVSDDPVSLLKRAMEYQAKVNECTTVERQEMTTKYKDVTEAMQEQWQEAELERAQLEQRFYIHHAQSGGILMSMVAMAEDEDENTARIESALEHYKLALAIDDRDEEMADLVKDLEAAKGE